MMPPMSSEDQARWRPYLDPGEQVLWSGRGGGGIAFSSIDFFLIPFFLIWTSIPAMVFFVPGDGEGAPPLPILFIPALFLIIGSYMLVGRFFVDAFRRTNTFYAVTDRRALILKQAFGARFHSIPLTPELELNVTPGAKTTITFGAKGALGSLVKMQHHVFGMAAGDDSFEQIPDGQHVYKLIRAQQQRKA